MKVATKYEIKVLSEDGLIKEPKDSWGEKAFYGTYNSEKEVDEAILKNGANYRDYVVLTVKQLVRDDEDEDE